MGILMISGNGNLSFENFVNHYKPVIDSCLEEDFYFIIGDFRGADILIMEYLKDKTSNVAIYTTKNNPYTPDKFKTLVSNWNINIVDNSPQERDYKMLELCTHFFAMDFNSNSDRKSGTMKNIEKAKLLNKFYDNN